MVADVMTYMGLTQQVLSPAFITLTNTVKIAGPAICAKGRVDAGDQALTTFGLDDSIYPGGIVIIDSNECTEGALIGDNMTTSMTNKGAIGFIVDGGIRDSDELSQQKLPVYYKYKSPINAHKFFSFTGFEVPITVDGVWGPVNIKPGDLIIADADGISIIPLAHAEQIIADSEIHLQTENTIKAALLAGESRAQVTRRCHRLKHVNKI